MDIQGKNNGTSKDITTDSSGNLLAKPYGTKYEQIVLEGNTYSFGISNTALVAANAIATALDGTAQPVIGLYNPSSTKNLIILKASVVITKLSDAAVAPGGFMWVGSNGNGSISTGSTTQVNMLTLAKGGSIAKVYGVSTALTGLTNSLYTIKPVSVSVLNAAGAGTAASIPQGTVEELVDGSIIVPPGGVVGIMNQVSTTTVFVSASLTWIEK